MTDVDKMIETMAEMRELMKEAHGLQKDLKQTIREAKQLSSKFISEELTEAFTKVVAEKVGELNAAVDDTMEKSVKKVYDRFDVLAGILLGEDRESRKAGRPSLYELAKMYVEQNGPVTDFSENEGAIYGRETGRKGK